KSKSAARRACVRAGGVRLKDAASDIHGDRFPIGIAGKNPKRDRVRIDRHDRSDCSRRLGFVRHTSRSDGELVTPWLFEAKPVVQIELDDGRMAVENVHGAQSPTDISARGAKVI